MTSKEAIELAQQWLTECEKPHGSFRSAYFLWRFNLQRWADYFSYQSLQEWKRAVKVAPVDDVYVLIEKWRIVFETVEATATQHYSSCVTVDVDDRTGRIRLNDGW
jgi:hypothetical protein